MRRGEEDDPLDGWEGLEDQVMMEFREDLGRTVQILKSPVGIQLKKPLAAFQGHPVTD